MSLPGRKHTMKVMKVKIQVQKNVHSADEQHVVMLNEKWLKKMNITVHQNVKLQFGSFKQEVKVVNIAQNDVLLINSSLADSMGIHSGEQLCLQYKASSNTLQIGPLIGVMVGKMQSNASDRPFGSTTSFFLELNEASRMIGAFIFFFSTSEINGTSDTIKGWHYNGGWSKRTFPLPNVVYNQVRSRSMENQAKVQKFIQHAKQQQVPTSFFNEKYLNKNEVFKALHLEQGIQHYLPETMLLRNFQTLKSMTTKYPTVFLKPINGSLGKGIIRVQRDSNYNYASHLTHASGSRKKTHKSLDALFSFLSSRMKTSTYQVQQGLSLITIDDRPVDFRVLVQRGEQGQWAVTSVVARIANNRHFVSNLARGGSLTTVKDALQQSRSIADKGSRMRLKQAALAIAKGIEAHIPGHFAELGVDLALDKKNRVWLIEVNSKPSKSENTPLTTTPRIRSSVKQIVRYCQFATGFSNIKRLGGKS